MPSVNPICYHLSASAIQSFKACPTRFRLSYREGLRPVQETDSQRVGTSWHAMFETYANAIAAACDSMEANPLQSKEDYAMERVVSHLNTRYAEKPNYKTMEEWTLERSVLLTSFIGYQWYYSEDPIEFLANELAFDLPVHMPKSGMPLSMDEVKRVGKIDHIIRWHGMVGALERKSTSRSIAPDSDYWDKSKKDTQVSMYALAFRDMIEAHVADDAKLPFTWNNDERFGNTLYDCWHKPTIKPKLLTQAETAEFLKSGMYFDQKFHTSGDRGTVNGVEVCTIDGEHAEIEQGKKGIAIKETVGMFSARLLNDIYERPDFYYQRREIARTDAEIRKFRKEVYAYYQNMKLVEKHDTWTENEQQCRATFPCQFIPICYGPGADAVCDGKTTPPNFKRIFVDLTVNNKELED